MCNYELLAAHTVSITGSHLISQIEAAIRKLEPLSVLPYMLVTSGGSFMDPHEVPDDVRLAIGERLRDAGLQRVSFESEPKFLTDQRLEAFRNVFSGKLSVGIGLESHNDFIRNVVLNKALRTTQFEHTVQKLRKYGHSYYTYVLFGKPFLTPDEDIQDTVDTILYASRLGAHMAVVEVTNIQPYTLTHYLWEKHRYQPPNLWGAVEVLRRLPAHVVRSVSIKNIDADTGETRPLAVATTCKNCAQNVVTTIEEWNYTRNIRVIEELLRSPCSCYAEWRQSMRTIAAEPIEMRVTRQYQMVAEELGVSYEELDEAQV